MRLQFPANNSKNRKGNLAMRIANLLSGAAKVLLVLGFSMSGSHANRIDSPAAQLKNKELSHKSVQIDCNDRNEACCAKWVDALHKLASGAPKSDQMNVLPGRIDRWRNIERRSNCAIRNDIEQRYN
jgi:hypothetical protein